MYNREGKKFWKFFLEMIPLGVKTCGESEFDIFEAKKRFPDPEGLYVSKSRKMRLFASVAPSFRCSLENGVSDFQKVLRET